MGKFVSILLLSLMSTSSFAGTTIFGMELGELSTDQLKKMFPATYIGVNRFTEGKMYSIPVKSVGVSGLKRLKTVFNKDRKLVGVLAVMSKSRFNQITQELNSQYKMVRQNIPYVGRRDVKFVDGPTEILLEAPSTSSEMSVNYILKKEVLFTSIEAMLLLKLS
ncbi:MAG: hypothetical protein HON68_02005 [Gammaproteobacteria bacterium]|nr:hypothetical protein [Gammaproteobacteria bacterium]MBT4787885.1 hypothetical protein [Gammaproteobacteria bacterium]